MAWFKLAEIALAGTKLPVYLHYDAGVKRSDALLGTGWWCPSLESRIFPTSEKRLTLTLLGGSEIFLFQSNDVPGEFVSRDTFWKAVKSGDGRYQVSGPGKSEFLYEAGHISEAEIGSDRLKWNYVDGGIVSVLKNGSPLVEVKRNPGEKKPTGIVVDGKPYDLTYQRLPIFTNVNGLPAVAGFSESLSKFQSGPQVLEMVSTPSEKGIVKTVITDSDLPKVREYIWDGASGQLESDGVWTYWVSPSATLGRSIVSRVDGKGSIESYESTPVVTKHVMPGGFARYRSFIKMDGPGYGKPRSDIVKDARDNIVTSTQWTYDEKWQLIRRIADQEVMEWFYDDGSHLLKLTRKYAGNPVGETTYDGLGRVLTQQDGKDLFTYAYGKEGVVTKRYYDGKLRSLLAEDNSGLRTYFPPTAQIDPNKMAAVVENAVQKSEPSQALRKLMPNSAMTIPSNF